VTLREILAALGLTLLFMALFGVLAGPALG
jgi:hypothetical protein